MALSPRPHRGSPELHPALFRAGTLTSYVGQAKILQLQTVMDFMELRKRVEGG